MSQPNSAPPGQDSPPSLVARLRSAEQTRQRVEFAVDAFRHQFEQDLERCRQLRAWRLMLAISKGYALLRGKERNYQRLFRWLLQIPSRGFGDMTEYEPRWPNILTYLPPEYRCGLLDGVTGEPEPARTDAVLGSPFPAPGRYDVVVLPVFELDFRQQRPQHIARRFAREGHRVFWISPSRRPDGGKAYEAVPMEPGLWEVRISAHVPNIYLESLDDETVSSILDCLERLLDDAGSAACCALLQLPFWRRIGIGLRQRRSATVLYDCMDNWATFPDVSEFLRSEEPLLASESDALIVTARELEEKYTARGLHPRVVRNGADFMFFRSARPAGLFSSLPRPIIGYIGAIAYWFDYDLFSEVARLRPSYSFVLVGGFGLESDVAGEQIHKLKGLPNVHLLGHKDYNLLPPYLAEFDVCTIPFVRNRVTDATDPVKMYEYFSQGKPVVATPLSELHQYQQLLYLGGTPEEFAGKLDQAVAESSADPRRLSRIAFSSENTWQQRQQDFHAAIRDAADTVSIIVVTHNSEQFVDPCLESVARETTHPAYEVIVVDNASTDGTVGILRRRAAADPSLRVIESATNLGFSAANNAGARAARGKYLVLLNADTLVTNGWLTRLLVHCKADPCIGILNPVTNFAGNEVVIDCEYTTRAGLAAFAAELALKEKGRRIDIPVAPLFCALIPRAVWEQAGELDEGYELGMFEDDDYSIRVKKAGYKVSCAEDCFVHHFGQGAFGRLPDEEYQRLFNGNRNRFESKWKIEWVPHKYRPGIRGVNRRFTPAGLR